MALPDLFAAGVTVFNFETKGREILRTLWKVTFEFWSCGLSDSNIEQWMVRRALVEIYKWNFAGHLVGECFIHKLRRRNFKKI